MPLSESISTPVAHAHVDGSPRDASFTEDGESASLGSENSDDLDSLDESEESDDETEVVDDDDDDDTGRTGSRRILSASLGRTHRLSDPSPITLKSSGPYYSSPLSLDLSRLARSIEPVFTFPTTAFELIGCDSGNGFEERWFGVIVNISDDADLSELHLSSHEVSGLNVIVESPPTISEREFIMTLLELAEAADARSLIVRIPRGHPDEVVNVRSLMYAGFILSKPFTDTHYVSLVCPLM